MKPILFLLTGCLAACGLIAWGLITRWGIFIPVPPEIPAAWNDPPILQIAETSRKAVLANPVSGAAWGELGMMFDAHEALAEARACYRQAMKLDANDPRWPYLLAEINNSRDLSESDKDEALRLYRLASQCPAPSQEHSAAILLSLADLQAELGQTEEANTIYRKVYLENPASAWAAYRYARTLIQNGTSQTATKIFMGLSRNPSARKKAAIALAEIKRRGGDTKDADGFDYAASLLPDDLGWNNPFIDAVAELRRGRRVLMSRYVSQESQSNWRGAVSTASALADQYPSVESQILLLKALVNVGDHEAALAVSEDLLRGPEGQAQVTTHAFRGYAYIGLADRAEAEYRMDAVKSWLEKAVAALKESVRVKPDYAPGHIYQGKALLRLGQIAEAEQATREGIRCRPGEWESYLILSDCLKAAGRRSEAIEAVQQSIKLANPNETRPRKALEALMR